MAGKILTELGTRATAQTLPTPGRTDEVRNSAGGYVFGLDCWARLERFLILGVDGGTYYVNERAHALDNVEAVEECIATDARRTVDTIVAVSGAGRASKNDPALFALACVAAAADKDARTYALAHLGDVARTGTHLFHFIEFVSGRRGWGRSLAAAVGDWYASKDADRLGYQIVKYRQRDGWSHRDVLRKAHPAAPTDEHKRLYDHICGRPATDLPKIVEGFQKVQAASDAAEAAEIVREYRLPWETVPSEHLAGDRVWRALLETPGSLPLGALIRNLGVLTNRGITEHGSVDAANVAMRLADREAIAKARIHPVGILNAMLTYKSGTSRGGVTWKPNSTILDALDDAFYLAFEAVEPTNKRYMLALDVSGSMGVRCNGALFTCREGTAAMAMVTAAVEKEVSTFGFSTSFVPLDISPRRRLDDNVRAISGLPFSGTDCSLPMVEAIRRKAEVDVFVVYTDNETWAGRIKPVQALREYREKSGIDAKLVVVGMTATEFTIADPTDAGMLDVVGFDTTAPQVISGFAAR